MTDWLSPQKNFFVSTVELELELRHHVAGVAVHTVHTRPFQGPYQRPCNVKEDDILSEGKAFFESVEVEVAWSK